MQFPEGFKQKYEQLLKEEASRFFDSFTESPERGFRVNPLKVKENVPESLKEAERVEWSPTGYRKDITGTSPEHQSGLVYIQEPSAMMVAEVLDPQPGQKVLDLCAAPGGKSTQIAGKLNGNGLLIANEIHPKRAKILSENIERFGVSNSIVTNASPEQLADVFPQYFDTILVDAPCSGEGMFRKDPEATKYWSPEYPATCAIRQKDILEEAIKMLAPGGTLVYSTCTFAPEENEQIMAHLLSNYPHLNAEEIEKFEGMVSGNPEWADGNEEIEKSVRLYPHLIKGEGHFVAKFKDTTEGNPFDPPSLKPAKLNKSQQRDWEDFWQQTLHEEPVGKKQLKKDQLFLVPENLPELKKIPTLRSGIHAGMFKKNRFEPNHALALALPQESFKFIYDMTEEEYHKYLHGETLQTGQNRGWLAVGYRGMVLGWGKEVKGTIKNFYPKGLRV